MTMTYNEIYNMIHSVGYPAAYNHFPDNTAKEPPFICFYYPASSDFMADNCNYVKKEQVYIELYTAEKDLAAEQALETVLRNNEMAYTRSETYIDAEKMYMQLYITEVYIDG